MRALLPARSCRKAVWGSCGSGACSAGPTLSPEPIPRGVKVWITRRDAGHLSTAFRSALRFTPPTGPLTPHLLNPPQHPKGFELYDCIFSVGFLCCRSSPRDGQIEALPESNRSFELSLDDAYVDHSISVWPNDGFSVSWPPARAIGNDLFETFCDRFEKVRIPISWTR